MPNIEPFEQHADRYEAWFIRHPAAYQSELAAVRELWPAKSDGLEIGVGAGHFAAPLEITLGVEPSAAMRRAAARRGIRALDGTAENLPFPDDRFDAALMVTTICFVDDAARSVAEMFRVLRPGGCAVIGFVDRESPLGHDYEERRSASVFYRGARFFSAGEVAALLCGTGFSGLEYRQTLFGHPDRIREPDPVRTGTGEGSFVVVRAWKPEACSC